MFYAITNLDGSPKTKGGMRPLPINLTQQPQVTIPLSDSRTGQITISMYEPASALITPGDTAFKVFYKNPRGNTYLLLNGIVMLPTYDYEAGTINFTVHDPTIHLKHGYLGYGSVSMQLSDDTTVDDPNVDDFTGGTFDGIKSTYGIPLDGRGIRVIVWDKGANTILRGGSIPYGIRQGSDDANPQPDFLDVGGEGIPPLGVGYVEPPATAHPIIADATLGSDTLTALDLSSTWFSDGSTGVAYTDIKAGMRLDGPSGLLGGALLPPYTVVVSVSPTEIVMNNEATANATAAEFIAEDAIYCQISRGDCAYDDITQLVQAAGGFECDWIPVDAENLGFSGDDWNPGEMCELYTANRVGSDKTVANIFGHPQVQLVHGEKGVHITVAPDTDQLRTKAVQVGPGGPNGAFDLENRAIAESDTAEQYGYYEDWQQATTAGTGDTPISNRLLMNRAKAILTAYQHPPKFMTIAIDADGGNDFNYAFGDDINLGDTISAYAKKGLEGFEHVTNEKVRITQVDLSQTDDDGNCQILLTVVPHLTADPGLTIDS